MCIFYVNLDLSSFFANLNHKYNQSAVLGRCSLSVLQTVCQVVVFGYLLDLLGAGCTLHRGSEKNLAHCEDHPDHEKTLKQALQQDLFVAALVTFGD